MTQYKGKKCDLINTPITKVDNKCFIQFHYLVLSLLDEKGRRNYIKIISIMLGTFKLV